MTHAGDVPPCGGRVTPPPPAALLQVPQPFIDMQHTPELQTEVNGMISFLDESMGNLTTALKATGLWAQTLLVYSPE